MNWIAALATLTAFAAKSNDEYPASPSGPAAELRRTLDTVRTAAKEPLEDRTERVRQALQGLSPHMPVHEKMAWINKVGDVGIDQDAFDRSLAEAAEMLSFAPLKEADLPRGFPTYTPVGFIEIKSFPTYRLARGTGFFPLFMHIQRNRIAMTAPVEMEYSVDDKGNTRQANMAFLYGNTEIGDLGKKGNIEVMDVQPLTVVSLGVRGPSTDEAIEDGHRRLRAWIRDHPAYRKAGEMRMMGYNSPGVANQRRFFELQIPIEKAAN